VGAAPPGLGTVVRMEQRPAMRKRTLALHGHRISYWEGGPEDATERDDLLVLVHGIAGSGQTWAPVLRELAARGDRRRVLAPDLLGHGESAKPRGDYSPGAYASGIRDLLGALGHTHATVVGHSLGGGVAMQFAYQFPEICDRLVLVDSGGLGREVNPLLRAVALPGAEWVLPVLTDRRVVAAVSAAGRLVERLPVRVAPSVQETARAFASLAESANRAAFVHTARSVLDLGGQRVDATDRLYLAAALPTLIVWGGRDGVIPVAHAHRAAAAIPGSELAVFEAAGHFPHVDEPARFADLLTGFLDRTAPAHLRVSDLAQQLADAAHPHDPVADAD
jgi:pimeloyl-ACP methyl ester carboxylesterase